MVPHQASLFLFLYLPLIVSVEEERIKAELAAQPPPDWSEGEKEGEIKVSPDKLSEKARLGLQVKSAIENNSHVCSLVLGHDLFA